MYGAGSRLRSAAAATSGPDRVLTGGVRYSGDVDGHQAYAPVPLAVLRRWCSLLPGETMQLPPSGRTSRLTSTVTMTIQNTVPEVGQPNKLDETQQDRSVISPAPAPLKRQGHNISQACPRQMTCSRRRSPVRTACALELTGPARRVTTSRPRPPSTTRSTRSPLHACLAGEKRLANAPHTDTDRVTMTPREGGSHQHHTDDAHDKATHRQVPLQGSGARRVPRPGSP